MQNLSHETPPVPPAAQPGSSLTLALNAAEARLQICAADARGNMVFAQSWNAPSQGVELLTPALADALRRSGHTPADIARIACVRGPGSFTGLRLALVTASGLSRASGALMAGLDYLPLLAVNAFAAMRCGRNAADETPSPLWVVTHARRNLVHAQAFAPESAETGCEADAPAGQDTLPRVRALSALLVLNINDPAPENCLTSHVAALGGHPVFVGSGATRNRDELAASLAAAGIEYSAAGPAYDHPSLETLCQASLRAAYSHEDPQALYARPCDAEENLPRIAAKLGLDPAEARKRLDALTRGVTICE
ncbi:tRNA (adenosine(37)-N6)-threonylcarbamoyltransferase complex dimerization subunit type 1 TsaB [Desulfovibrio sp. OttesenSCG-928-I05]|nr:tRNA (adenosine(37)-N6)-threonylcarbamoyltransferase complex dimerization subunit type 1 TsaB [Desulfovibrio sp. OttesenSCG-928-I05]